MCVFDVGLEEVGVEGDAELGVAQRVNGLRCLLYDLLTVLLDYKQEKVRLSFNTPTDIFLKIVIQ